MIEFLSGDSVCLTLMGRLWMHLEHRNIFCLNKLYFLGTIMGDKGGSKDKNKKEKQRKAKLTLKEKRKAKNEKKSDE